MLQETLTENQNWGLLGVFALLLGGLVKMVHWAGTRLLAQMDKRDELMTKRDEKLTGVIERNTEVVGANTTATLRLGDEMRSLVAANDKNNQRVDIEREKAVNQVESAIAKIPNAVVDEIQRRKINGGGIQ